MKDWVIDTNVLLVADNQHPDIDPECVTTCIHRLREIEKGGRVVVDDQYRILGEYENKLSYRGCKGVGAVFLKNLLRNQIKRLAVPLEEGTERGFRNFPPDKELSNFDPSDRKFVAVALACRGKPPILQATDSKWPDWEPALRRHGVTVEFLCPDEIHRFRVAKGAS